jgi:tetratricopeptide (TPR) repeat protein/transcriptional regulator with XRE-family HTH domain
MAKALDDRDMRAILTIYRRWTGASQPRIAAMTGVPQPAISEILNGKRQVVRLETFERFANGLGIPRERLGLAARPWEADRPDPADAPATPAAHPLAADHDTAEQPVATSAPDLVHPSSSRYMLVAGEEFARADALRLGVVHDEAPRADVVDLVGMPAVPVEPPRRVSPEVADALHGTLALYAKLDNIMGPRHVMATVAAQLDLVGRLLTVADGSTRTRVLQVGASFAEFAGWIHQDAGNLAVSARWSDRALEWAIEAGDPTMVAYVLTRKSHHAAAMRDRASTLGLAEAALRDADRVSPRTRALALRQIARGHALARNAGGCAQALDEARAQVANTDDFGAAERTLTGYCTPAYIELEAADCWLILGRTDEAVRIYEACLADWPAEFERDRGLHLARLGNAYAAGQEPERACAAALRAVPIVADTGSVRAADELRRIPERLGRWRHTKEVHALTEALTTLPSAERQRRP